MAFSKLEDILIQSSWAEASAMQHSKMFITPSKQKSIKLLSMNKKHLNIYISLITGHCPAGYHLNKIRLSPTDICRFCDCETETSKHLLCDCSALSAKRRRIFNKGIISPIDIWLEDPGKVVDFILEILPNWGMSQNQPMIAALNGNVSS